MMKSNCRNNFVTFCFQVSIYRYIAYSFLSILKLIFSKKAAKILDIFTVDLTVTTYCQINGEDFVNFCGLLRKHELYESGAPQFFSHSAC